jgi:WD40 repeat protein
VSIVADTDPGTDTAWTTEVDDAPVSLSAAGDLVAIAGAAGRAWVLHTSTGERVGELSLADGLLRAALSPDAQHLAVTGPGGHALWRRSDGRVRTADTALWSQAATWAGRNVAVASGRRALVLSADGDELWSTEPAASTITDVAWLRGGRRLAVAAYGAVRCHERHQRPPVSTYSYVGSHLALAVTPNDRWICSGNQDASIHIWRTRDGDELTMSGYPEKVSRLAFDDTGCWLAADGAPDVTVWDFSGKGPAGTAPRSLRAHETITALAWRPGSVGHLASGGADGTVALWRATSGRPEGRLRPVRTFQLGAAIAALAWVGPQLLVTADRGGRIEAHKLPDKKQL